MADVNAVVVGVGRMGQHHARNYAAMEGFKLVGVVDSNAEARAKAVEKYGGEGGGCKAFATVGELLAWSKEMGVKVGAASVAVPTVAHLAVTEELARAGVDLLIEKPLSPNL